MKTVSMMVLAAGLCIFLAGLNRRLTPEIVLLSLSCALGLSIIDIYYSLNGVISNVYLLDAIPELAIAILWITACFRYRKDTPESDARTLE